MHTEATLHTYAAEFHHSTALLSITANAEQRDATLRDQERGAKGTRSASCCQPSCANSPAVPCLQTGIFNSQVDVCRAWRLSTRSRVSQQWLTQEQRSQLQHAPSACSRQTKRNEAINY